MNEHMHDECGSAALTLTTQEESGSTFWCFVAVRYLQGSFLWFQIGQIKKKKSKLAKENGKKRLKIPFDINVSTAADISIQPPQHIPD